MSVGEQHVNSTSVSPKQTVPEGESILGDKSCDNIDTMLKSNIFQISSINKLWKSWKTVLWKTIISMQHSNHYVTVSIEWPSNVH